MYGSDSKTAEELRNRNASLGLMDVRPFLSSGAGSRPILPPEEGGFCRSKDTKKEPCLRAGDERVNENQGVGNTVITSIYHTKALFTRVVYTNYY